LSKTALLVIDVQKDVVANGYKTSEVVSHINSLINQARTKDLPVIWVQHSDDYLIKGSDGWEFVDELKPAPDDLRIYKTEASSFAGTPLLEELKSRGISHLVVTGAQTDMCVNATSNDGAELGFKVTLVSDAHTTEDNQQAKAIDIIAEKNRSFASLGEVLPTSAISF
jgi:nicotinamidase-related amidase